MHLTSTAFDDGQTIPDLYTGVGKDVSPPLAWSHVPQGTKSLAVICDDPDAPTRARPRPEGPWVHWCIYNIPADVSDLSEGVPRQSKLEQPAGARQGANDFPSENVGYRGPMPPPGSGPHRYRFTIYALDAVLDLPAASANKKSLLRAMEGQILGESQLVGVYERS
ncbi:MAG: YbhB/YbcL family Raf kinase inhibitor-like protein [Pirellulales bacterium]